MQEHPLPILDWASGYSRPNARGDLAAGLTVGAMLVPQAMAYALLAGLPPEVGLYAATVPLIAYALFGSSRQLAVGPVAIVSLLTASALAPVVEQGSAAYLHAAALLAVMVGLLHLALGVGRLGFVVNFLSHSVLVGFTAAAGVIIGASQIKHLLGVSFPRQEYFLETVRELFTSLPDVHGVTFLLGLASLLALIGLKRYAPKVPAALVVVIGSVLIVRIFGLEARGVQVIGDVPSALPTFGLPTVDGSVVRSLLGAAALITVVGFMESIAVSKVYAGRHRYEVIPNQELIGLGAANVAAGLFGGYPVTGGFSRTAVNDTAGARTPMASVITAVVVLVALTFFTPLFSSLPNASLAAIIVMAVAGLIDGTEIRRIARVKRSDLIGLGTAFGATLALGIEVGIAVAVVASFLVVFARMYTPHSAVLGRVKGTTSYRNVGRFPESDAVPGVRIVRIDAAISFVNSVNVRKLILAHADDLTEQPRALVIDASGINDLDATGADMVREVLMDVAARGVALHLAGVKGPVRDVLRGAGLWSDLAGRVHASTHAAVLAIDRIIPACTDQRRSGVDERPRQTISDL